jgi:uncharacterized protein YneF (UPF0154 family)
MIGILIIVVLAVVGGAVGGFLILRRNKNVAAQAETLTNAIGEKL